jgi:hypothetical protein
MDCTPWGIVTLLLTGAMMGGGLVGLYLQLYWGRKLDQLSQESRRRWLKVYRRGNG